MNVSTRRMGIFLAVVIGIMLLLAVLPVPAKAGYRVELGHTLYTSTTPIFTDLWIDGLHNLRLRGHGPGAASVTVELYYWDGDSWESSGTNIFPAGGELNTKVYYAANSTTNNEARLWKLAVTTAMVGVTLDWYEISDVYGDPTYQHSLLNQIITPVVAIAADTDAIAIDIDAIATQITAAPPTVATDTLTSGNVWAIDRTWTYGDITNGIVSAGVFGMGIFLALMAVVQRQ